MKPYYETDSGKLYAGDVSDVLDTLPEKSVNMCITSPPYWALRDYGTATWKGGDENCDHQIGRNTRGGLSNNQKGNKGSFGDESVKNGECCPKCGAKRIDKQLGLEPTFDEYINRLCDIFDGVKRVLRDDGTCWVNIGDTYWGSGAGTQYEPKTENAKEVYTIPYYSHKNTQRNKDANYKSKCLVQIPHRFAIEMTNRGWILRNTIIWHKPNCMPSSIKDRFTVDFEYMFFFSKKKKYYFEQQFDNLKHPEAKGMKFGGDKAKGYGNPIYSGNKYNANNLTGRNKRTVWTIPTKPFSEAHFAVFPEELITTPIKAGCPQEVCKKCGKPKELVKVDTGKRRKVENYTGEATKDYDNAKAQNPSDTKRRILESQRIIYETKLEKQCDCNAGFEKGTVLDIFMGAGTTGLVAEKMNRNWVGIDLNKEYCDIAIKRIDNEREQLKLEFL